MNEARIKNPSALANAIPISRSTVWGWLNDNKRPAAATCADLARVLRVPLSEVFRHAGYPVSDSALAEEPAVYQATRLYDPRIAEIAQQLANDPERFSLWIEMGESLARRSAQGHDSGL